MPSPSEATISDQRPPSVNIGVNVESVLLPLRSVAIGCIGHLMFVEGGGEPEGVEQNYLFHQYATVSHIDDLSNALQRCLAKPAKADIKIAALARMLQLSEVEVIAIVLAMMAEEEPMMGRVFAHIQAPTGGSRPTLGLVEAILNPVLGNEDGQWLAGTVVSGTAVSSGVLQILNDQVPLPEQSFKVPTQLALALRGRPYVWQGAQMMDSTVRLPSSIHEQAVSHARAVAYTPNSVLVIRAASRQEARAVAQQVAIELNQEPLFIEPLVENLKGLGALCRISERLPVFEYGLSTGEQPLLPELTGYSGPRLVLIGPDGQVNTGRGSILQWNIAVPDRAECQQLWRDYLDDDELAHQLANDHIHSAGRINELAQLAEREAQLQQRQRPELVDVRRAAWEAEAGVLGSLAQPITAEIPDDALILSKLVRTELQQLLSRCHCREHLDKELGVTIKARYQQGVRCLMVGPSGTGKTLAASWLATHLGLPLYRVDLASVVSKYIGETEKNLAELLSRAEHSEIVLLFDEADSLFGKRTDIKDSSDRFANSQTNYLLQRIEFYRGIVLLTSNSRDRFDSAFTRRLDKIVEFSMPSPKERRALWQTHLGSKHQLTTKQINQLAVSSDLAGGHIRNAVLSAAVAAQEEKRMIAFRDLAQGLAGEYRKLGRQFPAELKRYEQLDHQSSK